MIEDKMMFCASELVTIMNNDENGPTTLTKIEKVYTNRHATDSARKKTLAQDQIISIKFVDQ